MQENRRSKAQSFTARGPSSLVTVLEKTVSHMGSVSVYFGLPTFFDFLFHLCFPLGGSHFHLYPFAGPENLALQVEGSATALLGLVKIVQLFEAFHNVLHIRNATLRRFDVEDFAGFVEGHPGGGSCVEGARIVFGSGFCILRRCMSLLVGFCERSAENSPAGQDDLGNDSMRLRELVSSRSN